MWRCARCETDNQDTDERCLICQGSKLEFVIPEQPEPQTPETPQSSQPPSPGHRYAEIAIFLILVALSGFLYGMWTHETDNGRRFSQSAYKFFAVSTPTPTIRPTIIPRSTTTPNPTLKPIATPTLTTKTTVRPAETPTPLYLSTASKGDKGYYVTRLQIELIKRNYLYDSADGDYGDNTAEAVKELQRDAGLSQTGDFDYATLTALEKYDYRRAFSSQSGTKMIIQDSSYHSDQSLWVDLKNIGETKIDHVRIHLIPRNSSGARLGNSDYYYCDYDLNTTLWPGETTTCILDVDFSSDKIDNSKIDHISVWIYSVKTSAGKTVRINSRKIKVEKF